jgi:hypothetical protein
VLVKKGTGILAKILLIGIQPSARNLFVVQMEPVLKIYTTMKKIRQEILLNLKHNKLQLKEIAND